MSGKSTNITWHEQTVSKERRREKNKHHSYVLWFTGLSGSGKSSVANAVAERLFQDDTLTYVLDGDNIRFGINKDLGFSEEDRKENIRRIGEVSKLFVDSGQVVLTAFISPFRNDREGVRELLEGNEFVEVYVKCSLEACEARDPKGLYEKARQGIIKDFTGISSPYEEPVNPEIVIDSEKNSIEECVEQIVQFLKEKGYYRNI
ncbi:MULTISPECIES: adenylyl-sulfate kinase [Bacillaceae]|uniref:adenylyl-sulfate kinase n=1 Tax=Bacillaceae TaxID=186817 RepID=UPI001E4DB9AD|nr:MULTISPECIES: adenylyl-sulfate kinase [Bacillaceae]MCE4050586.1 adenylyl-sulfate kinase [Bacillus sp. Au-Bac7]MCM3032014.1 adenylyl-sulfate kinase [Niallia sp. MER 6]MDL0435981.1 adenylyl-sulfate kinase [Niallia sp. SS-2023]UPO87849.1 adenylyl-sulfate kinase [Niallia sp. Man26]